MRFEVLLSTRVATCGHSLSSLTPSLRGRCDWACSLSLPVKHQCFTLTSRSISCLYRSWTLHQCSVPFNPGLHVNSSKAHASLEAVA